MNCIVLHTTLHSTVFLELALALTASTDGLRRIKRVKVKLITSPERIGIFYSVVPSLQNGGG